ncbi:MAG: class I SAM-dependent methyltransferase [Polyangiaceae bacterium]|nr:class I SAM-dependent methyltransferase [Polyangiaceae bacterium]
MTPAAALLCAIDARRPRLSPTGAARLFTGEVEGGPGLVVEWLGGTVVVFDHARAPRGDAGELVDAIASALPEARAIVWTSRHAAALEERRGVVVRGEAGALARRVIEDGVSYALDVTAFRDASFYVDTRALRAWLRARARGLRVLNLFAHTGSLGIAAQAAGAASVVQVDRDRAALTVAKTSASMNRLPIDRRAYVVSDVFPYLARARRLGALFDVALLDPPFFSQTSGGRVDVEASLGALIDKVRPVVADGGALVVVTNALFVSGSELEAQLARVVEGGYAAEEARLDAPDDVVGLTRADGARWPTDPSPWAHPTKIAALRLRRRDGRR